MTQKQPRTTRMNRFSQMARRPGGISMEAAVAAADRSLEQLKPRYLSWAAADVQELERMITALSGESSDILLQLPAIYTKASQIRDLGATFDFELTTAVADRLCELLHRLQHAHVYNALAVHTHLSALQLVCTEAYRGKHAADEPALLGGLSKVIEKFPAVSAADQRSN